MLDRALETILPLCCHCSTCRGSSKRRVALDPPRRRRATLDAVKRLLLRESQDRPLLLVSEDLHWIDSESQALFDELVESLPTARILLLVNYRPEYTHTWGNKASTPRSASIRWSRRAPTSCSPPSWGQTRRWSRCSS